MYLHYIFVFKCVLLWKTYVNVNFRKMLLACVDPASTFFVFFVKESVP